MNTTSPLSDGLYNSFSPQLLRILIIGFLSLLSGLLPAADCVYWSESTRNPDLVSTRILRAFADGGAVETVLELGNSENVLGGIAVDVANGHLYCGSGLALFRTNLDGTGRVDLVPAMNNVGDVELDVAGGKVYWSEGGGGMNAIRRANLDGSHAETLRFIGYTGMMEGIALDLQARRIYFAQNVNEGDDSIQSMNLDGTNVTVFQNLDDPSANPHDVEIDAARRLLYWNQTPSQGIFQASLDGPPNRGLISAPSQGVNNGFYFDPACNRFFVGGATSDRIEVLSRDGGDTTTIIPSREFVNYIEVAHQPDKLYWTESTRNPALVSTRIMSALTDGTAVKAVLELGNSENVLGGIAVDAANGHLYCGSGRALFRTNLDGTGRVDLVSALNNVGDVELDVAVGKVYWTEGAGGMNAIRRANLDGSHAETLRFIGFAGMMEGIALDLQAGRVYFAQNINDGNDTLWSMNLDGSDPVILKTLNGALANPHDVEIDVSKRSLYWNQTPSQGIFRVSLVDSSDGSDLSPVVVPPGGVNNGFYFDAISKKVFVSGTGSDRIQSLNIDGSGFNTLVQGRPVVNYIEVARAASHFRSTPVIDRSSISHSDNEDDGPVTLNLSGHAMPGLVYTLEASSDLSAWTALGNSKAVPGTGAFTFAVTEEGKGARRFYRVQLRP